MAHILPTTPLGNGVYWLNEYDVANLYLIIGRERALLIDCGLGLCDLAATVHTVTNLPVIAAVTHGHIDHMGGAGAFGALWVPQADCARINRVQRSYLLRRLFFQTVPDRAQRGLTAQHLRKDTLPVTLLPFTAEKTFDLGGRVIRVIATPGHTVGSVTFVDDTAGMAFCGDDLCDALWLHLPGATSVEAWLPGARTLLALSRTHRLYWGHRTPLLDPAYIATVVHWGEEIMQRQTKNARLSRVAVYPPQPDGIRYRTGHVFEK